MDFHCKVDFRQVAVVGHGSFEEPIYSCCAILSASRPIDNPSVGNEEKEEEEEEEKGMVELVFTSAKVGTLVR